ncbi:MAG: hypothetical protein Q7R41_11375, partial [Phycisphaerales bacterium]|nr:hypothetical protein [Phycisphaerales bacterium]
PTGNLDSRNGEQIMKIFHELHAAGITIVLVTHEMDIAAQAERMIQMRDGRIIEDRTIDDNRREELMNVTHDVQARAFRAKFSHKAGPAARDVVPGT